MMMQRIRNADRKTKPEQSLREPEGVEIVIAAEQRARHRSPYQRGRRERKIRQVRSGEQYGGQAHGRTFARKQAGEARHEVIVQKKLLVERPQNVSRNVLEVAFV